MRSAIPIVRLCGLTAALLSGACAAEPRASEELARLFHDQWEFTLREQPLFATQVGDHRYNNRLPSVTVEDHTRRLEAERGFLERLRRIDRSALDPAERISYDIFERLREDEIAEGKFRSYLMPITSRSGFHISFPELPKRVPLDTEGDYRDYIERLDGFRDLVAQYIELMRAGIREGFTLPGVVLEGYENSLRPHIVDEPRRSLLWEPFEDMPAAIHGATREELRAEGARAITRSVVPGYSELLRFMRDEYVPAAREEIAASTLPDGRAFYEHRVRRFTTLPLTPEEVHETGLEEVARIRAEMEGVIRRVGFPGAFREFVDFLRTDPRFYVHTPEALMQRTALVLKEMDGRLPELFGRLPRMPYGLRAVPEFIAPKTTTAYYNAPAGDGSRAGFYYLNTYDLKSRPLYEIEALSLHEAVPGHHLQIALQQELEDLPPFRRFAGVTAFVEGWALYAERLGLETGFYRDPYSDFGRLTYEMWRALRLVVDPGIHYLGWSRQQAIDYMAENSALTVRNITNEVDRYIAWPGQAVAYKTGELKIRELRALAESELAADFDLRAFHDRVLGSGAVPLDILESQVRAWIDEERRSAGTADGSPSAAEAE